MTEPKLRSELRNENRKKNIAKAKLCVTLTASGGVGDTGDATSVCGGALVADLPQKDPRTALPKLTPEGDATHTTHTHCRTRPTIPRILYRRA